VLGQELPWLDEMVRAQRPVRLPTVLGEAEVRRLLAQLDAVPAIMVGLLYGVGLRPRREEPGSIAWSSRAPSTSSPRPRSVP
jgi:integrase